MLENVRLKQVFSEEKVLQISHPSTKITRYAFYAPHVLFQIVIISHPRITCVANVVFYLVTWSLMRKMPS